MSKSLKRTLSILLLAALCAAPMSAMAEYMTVKGGGLNLRETASLSAKVLGQYPTGTWIDVVEEGDTWSKVQIGGKTGYMMSKYLSDTASSNTRFVRTNTGIGLNLRSAPSLTGGIITSYPIGTAVTVLKSGSNWCRVQIGDNTGYMNSAYLKSSNAPVYTKPVETPYTAKLVNINGGSIVNFRLYPGMKTKILDQLPVGTEVTVLEKGVNWSMVEVNGVKGYVSTYFLK